MAQLGRLKTPTYFLHDSTHYCQTDSYNKNMSSKPLLFHGYKYAMVGGLISTIVTLTAQFLIGNIYSSYQAHKLLTSLTSNSGYLGSAAITASTTILALMLTLLSLGKNTSQQLSVDFYKKVKRTAAMNILLLILGALLLQVTIIPIIESEQINPSWYTTIYYTHLTITSLIVGLLVAIILMLYTTITTLIDIIKPSANK